MAQRIRKNQRHIRWYSEEPKDNLGKIRFHVVVVDDKNREATLMKFLEPLTEFGTLELVNKTKGKVVGTKFRYIFRSYDTNVSHKKIFNFGRPINGPVKRDEKLYERVKKGCSIENYVANLYGN